MSSFKAAQPSSVSGPSGVSQDEFTVRIPRDTRRRFTMMKFGSGTSIDFAKLGDQPVKIERENNLKEYKTANDIDMLPKFGVGSEYGRDQKEESRRKKYGIMLKKYNPNDQPWNLKIGAGKQAKRYKGLREGTISENTSYYIFTKAADGAFEAFPVEEWYNFSPVIRYKYLNSEEAEEEYSRRGKTLNLFNIMLKKRMKKEDDTADDDDVKVGSKEGKKSKKKKKDLILTDIDEWNDMEMSDEDDDDSDGEDKGGEEEGKPKKKPKGNIKKKIVKNSKKNSDDEAVEESDEGDYDDREVDYMSDSGSSSSLSGVEENDKEKKYEEKGVDEEAGLRNILDSEAEDDEEEEGEKEENEDEPDEKDEKKEERKKDDDSSSSSLEDDSDIEKDGRLASALFLQKERKDKKERKEKPDDAVSESGQKSENRNRTPTPDKLKDKAVKRKADKTPEGKPDTAKRHKGEDSDGITEVAIRRYLMRKPMTTKDLLQKFKSKKLNMSNEKITHVIAQLLKKINPDKMVIHKKLYLSLKKPD